MILPPLRHHTARHCAQEVLGKVMGDEEITAIREGRPLPPGSVYAVGELPSRRYIHTCCLCRGAVHSVGDPIVHQVSASQCSLHVCRSQAQPSRALNRSNTGCERGQAWFWIQPLVAQLDFACTPESCGRALTSDR